MSSKVNLFLNTPEVVPPSTSTLSQPTADPVTEAVATLIKKPPGTGNVMVFQIGQPTHATNSDTASKKSPETKKEPSDTSWSYFSGEAIGQGVSWIARNTIGNKLENVVAATTGKQVAVRSATLYLSYQLLRGSLGNVGSILYQIPQPFIGAGKYVFNNANIFRELTDEEVSQGIARCLERGEEFDVCVQGEPTFTGLYVAGAVLVVAGGALAYYLTRNSQSGTKATPEATATPSTADSRTRTSTQKPGVDFESTASTNSAIPAKKKKKKKGRNSQSIQQPTLFDNVKSS